MLYEAVHQEVIYLFSLVIYAISQHITKLRGISQREIMEVVHVIRG